MLTAGLFSAGKGNLQVPQVIVDHSFEPVQEVRSVPDLITYYAGDQKYKILAGLDVDLVLQDFQDVIRQLSQGAIEVAQVGFEQLG